MNSSEVSERTIRRIEGGRLAYYREAADIAYWDKHWGEMIRPEFYADAIQGQLGKFEKLFTKYLPTDARILEAGCGPAQWVVALRKRGYDVEGIDWAQETIERVHRIFPDLPIRSGDACALEVDNGFYGAYVSLGVVEHRAAGPEPFLTEAFRVLKPGGMAILSVPWLNPLRRVKAWLGCFKSQDVRGMEFYQYAFRVREMKRHIADAGFTVIETQSSYNVKDGFEDELLLLDRFYRKGAVGRVLKRMIRKSRLISRHSGHMRIYVCKKPLL